MTQEAEGGAAQLKIIKAALTKRERENRQIESLLGCSREEKARIVADLAAERAAREKAEAEAMELAHTNKLSKNQADRRGELLKR